MIVSDVRLDDDDGISASANEMVLKWQYILRELDDEFELEPLGIPSWRARSHSGPKFISVAAISVVEEARGDSSDGARRSVGQARNNRQIGYQS